MAIGLSDDNKMGKDSVIECVNEAGSIKAYASWTEVALGKFDAPRNVVRILKRCLILMQRFSFFEDDSENPYNTNIFYLLLASKYYSTVARKI